MNKNDIKKKKKREEKKRLGKGKTDLKKGFTDEEKKKGKWGIMLVLLMASLAVFFAFFQMSKWA